MTFQLRPVLKNTYILGRGDEGNGDKGDKGDSDDDDDKGTDVSGEDSMDDAVYALRFASAVAGRGRVFHARSRTRPCRESAFALSRSH